MANYSVSQVRHLYVANNGYVANGTSEGTITGVKKNTNEGELFFFFKGVDGVIKSDYIPKGSIVKIKALSAEDLAYKLRKIEVALNPSINSGKPVQGQDYILGINFRNFFSLGDDSQYYKDVAVRVTPDITNAEGLFNTMKTALDQAFAREDGASATSNPYLAFSVSGSGNSAKLVIEEKEQEWTLGLDKQRRIMFDVLPSTIYVNQVDVIWAAQNATTGAYYTDVTNSNTNVVGDGKSIADLEWFCMGERGDQYRGMGWPNYIPTKYLVDPSKQYDALEIHFSFSDTGVNSYKTEKQITIVAPFDAEGETVEEKHAKMNAIINALKAEDSSLNVEAWATPTGGE